MQVVARRGENKKNAKQVRVSIPDAGSSSARFRHDLALQYELFRRHEQLVLLSWITIPAVLAAQYLESPPSVLVIAAPLSI